MTTDDETDVPTSIALPSEVIAAAVERVAAAVAPGAGTRGHFLINNRPVTAEDLLCLVDVGRAVVDRVDPAPAPESPVRTTDGPDEPDGMGRSVYVQWRDGDVDRSECVGACITLDRDADGGLLGVEVLGAVGVEIDGMPAVPQAPVDAFGSDYTSPQQLDSRIRLLIAAANRVSSRTTAALTAVLDLHRERRIYDVCGHDHLLDPDDTLPAGLVAVNEVGVVCEDGFEYSACAWCCCGDNGDVTEECATGHDSGDCWPCTHHRTITNAFWPLHPATPSGPVVSTTKASAS